MSVVPSAKNATRGTMPRGPMVNLLHFAEDGDTSGFFPQLARWHDRSRFRMTFGTLKPITAPLREFMESQGVECLSLDCRRRSSYPAGLLRLAGMLRRRRIDILHTHLFDPSVVGLMAGVLGGTRVRVETRHYSDYHTRIHKHLHVKLDQLCTRLAHRVIAVSQHTTDHLISDEGAPESKVRTIHNGIDFDRVSISSLYARERIRREFVPDGGAMLVTVGRLHPEKGYEYLFPALRLLKTRTTRSFALFVCGSGPFEAAFREQVRAQGCDDVVRFLGFRQDVPDLIAAADLMVLPSLAEAFGLAITEALYLGTPVVATRVGGIPEIVRDGIDGILVPPANSEALAAVVGSLLDDPIRLASLAGAGRDRVTELFRFADMVRAYEAVYDELLGRLAEPAHA